MQKTHCICTCKDSLEAYWKPCGKAFLVDNLTTRITEVMCQNQTQHSSVLFSFVKEYIDNVLRIMHFNNFLPLQLSLLGKLGFAEMEHFSLKLCPMQEMYCLV